MRNLRNTSDPKRNERSQARLTARAGRISQASSCGVPPALALSHPLAMSR